MDRLFRTSIVSFAVLALFLSFYSAEEIDNPVCQYSGEVLPDPSDCHSYFLCSAGIAFYKECPPNTHFSPIFKACMDPQRAGCIVITPTEPETQTPPTVSESPETTPAPTTPEVPSTPSITPSDEPTTPSHPATPSEIPSTVPTSPSTAPPTSSSETSTTFSVTTTESPKPEFQCPASQGLFPNPVDCNSFYHCDHGVAHLKECPSNLHFNPSLMVCDWPENADCEVGSKPTIPPPDPTGGTSDKECDCECCIKPDPSDCRKYIKCRNGKAYESSCSGGLVFNPEIQNCDYRKNVECPDDMIPDVKPDKEFKCPSSEGMFPNPKDCGSFYRCVNNIPYLNECPLNLHFNKDKLICDWPENAGCEGGSTSMPPVKPTGQPEPDITCPCDDCVFPNPTETCFSYYRCIDGKAYLQSCSDGLLFNPEINSCDFRSNVHCLSPTSLPPMGFVCPNSIGLFPNPVDCGSYFYCYQNVSYLRVCADKLHFNPVLQVCDWPENAGCIDPAVTQKPPVYVNGTCPCTCCLLPDKNNCHAFFSCKHDEMQYHSCGHNLTFNPETHNCEPENSFKCTDSKPSEFPCPNSQGLFPHPTDCSKFYHCDHDIGYLQFCPPGLHFSKTLKVCTWPEDAGCDDGEKNICSKGNGLYPNPQNCESYFLCSNGEPKLLLCPIGLHFNPKTNKCDWPSVAGCREEPLVTKPVTTPAPGIFTCPKPSGFFPHPTKCVEYYECINGKAIKRFCPSDLHFNPQTMTCDWPSQAGCTSEQKPTTNPGEWTCPEPQGLFPNPVDCNSYYQCDDGIANQKLCPLDLHFNPKILQCDWPSEAGCGENPTLEPDGSGEKPDGSGEEPENDITAVICPNATCHCRFRDPKDCSAYYACSDGIPYPHRCPIGLRFNNETEVCDIAKNVIC